MFCPYCGRNVADKSAFCSFCGENISDIFADEDKSQPDEILDTPNKNVDEENLEPAKEDKKVIVVKSKKEQKISVEEEPVAEENLPVDDLPQSDKSEMPEDIDRPLKELEEEPDEPVEEKLDEPVEEKLDEPVKEEPDEPVEEEPVGTNRDIVKANELYEKAMDIIYNTDDYSKRSNAISILEEALDCISAISSSDMYVEIEKDVANEITIFAMLCAKNSKDRATNFESSLKHFSRLPEGVFYVDDGDTICNFATSILGYRSITGKKHNACKMAYDILLNAVENNVVLENNLGFAYAALGDFNYKGVGIDVNAGKAERFYMKAQDYGFDCLKKLIEVQGL